VTHRILTIGVTLMLGVATAAHATDMAAFAAAKDSLRSGVDRGRAATVLGARAAFESLAETEPDSVTLGLWVATCDWRATPLAQRGGSADKVAAAICDHGLATIERVLKRSPRDAEALALKAGLLGLSLSFREASASMTIGPQLVALFGQARGIAPDAPRVAFLDALNTLHMPEFYGGGAKKALPAFEHAIALFRHDSPAGPLSLDWGRDDAALWAGRSAAQLGDKDKARAFYRQALEIDPENGWVRTGLLPALDAPAAADTTRSEPHR
jgi:tetratricopeptide (TPR) repeat protein